MDPRPPSRRSFLVGILTRAAGLWVAVTGGLAALGAGCDDRAGAGPAGKQVPEPPLYGARRPEPPKYGAPVSGPPQTLYGAPRPPPPPPVQQPEPVPAPRAAPPRTDAPKYGAPVPRSRRDAKPKAPPEGS